VLHDASERSACAADDLLSVATVPADRPGRVIVVVGGEVDQFTAPLLSACLRTQLGRGVVSELVVDMAAVRFLGAAGLAVLVTAHARSRALGVHLTVRCDGARPVLRPLRLAGLATLLCIDGPAAPEWPSGCA
jgi:anti-anti-sigma factor